MGNSKLRIRTAQQQKGGTSVLIEMLTNEGADWLMKDNNASKLVEELRTKIIEQNYTMIVKFVPLTFDEEKEITEILEDNNIPKEELVYLWWIKPKEKRAPTQQVGHMLLTLTNPITANRCIEEGLTIHSQAQTTEKSKNKPLKCLKCQKFSHYAKDCLQQHDTCSGCRKDGHRILNCTNRNKC
ncbi:hypothetical protein FA15DRAFT_589706 [Coprinopsis marcescibilis]|uniref:CCHC-type domain-containing protein n=1 Tax=Coprinopsis marcescibilis TaxID=230819 RepID=A0A5C3KYP7_COPMA|nr:hypothetical protein FA15DRAFT_589706 [Coprinopsis marcescibilis]